jgi:hypothetical protein
MLAADNARLLRVQLQTALSKPPLQHTLEPSRLHLAHTVAEGTVSVTLEPDLSASYS